MMLIILLCMLFPSATTADNIVQSTFSDAQCRVLSATVVFPLPNVSFPLGLPGTNSSGTGPAGNASSTAPNSTFANGTFSAPLAPLTCATAGYMFPNNTCTPSTDQNGTFTRSWCFAGTTLAVPPSIQGIALALVPAACSSPSALRPSPTAISVIPIGLCIPNQGGFSTMTTCTADFRNATQSIFPFSQNCTGGRMDSIDAGFPPCADQATGPNITHNQSLVFMGCSGLNAPPGTHMGNNGALPPNATLPANATFPPHMGNNGTLSPSATFPANSTSPPNASLPNATIPVSTTSLPNATQAPVTISPPAATLPHSALGSAPPSPPSSLAYSTPSPALNVSPPPPPLPHGLLHGILRPL